MYSTKAFKAGKFGKDRIRTQAQTVASFSAFEPIHYNVDLTLSRTNGTTGDNEALHLYMTSADARELAQKLLSSANEIDNMKAEHAAKRNNFK